LKWGQNLGAPGCDGHHVAMPHSAIAIEVHTWLDVENHAGLEHFFGGGMEPRAGIVMMESKCKQLALGALAGLAGTMILQAARGAQQKKLPRATPPIQRDPGEFMIKKVEQILPERARARISKGLESIGAMSLGIGYGTTFGSAYAALRRRPRNVLAEGAALGIASWAVG